MNEIFTHFLSRGDKEEDSKRLTYASWFVNSIPATEFQGDELLFYEYLKYSVKIDVPVVFKYLQVWCSTELREVLHRTNARVTGCETLRFEDPSSFETIFQITSRVLEDDFKILETVSSNIDDFKIEVASYFNIRRREALTTALSRTFDVLNDTDSSTQAADMAENMIREAKLIYDVSKLDVIGESKTDDNMRSMDFVTDSGIPAIDNDSQGIHTKQLFGLEGQSGSGKTRFVLGTWVYRALTIHKKNVLFFELELSKAEVNAMLVACHVFHLFNIQLSDSMILYGTVPDELKDKVEAATIDLFESGKYGKFYCMETTLYIETFIPTIVSIDRMQGPFDLIVVDYMGLMESKPISQYDKRIEWVECVRRGYRLYKQYCRDNNKAGIAVGQFNAEGATAGENDKIITTTMAQGGMAVFQNTDYNVEISMTETMRLQQKRRISQAKVRGAAGFPRFLLDVRLGFLYFKQIVQSKV